MSLLRRMYWNVNLSNVILVGVAFMFIFTAFQTASQLSQNVLEAAHKESGADVGVGYVSLAILYATFAIVNWFAPPIVLMLGHKYSMLLGGVCYAFFVASFMEPRAWSLYLCSIITGFGAAVLWTAQGAFVTKCSTESNTNRNFTIFWALFQTSQLVGGLYTRLSLYGISEIGRDMRHQLYGGFLGCALFGCILILFLREIAPPSLSNEDQRSLGRSAATTLSGSRTNLRSLHNSIWQIFCRSFQLLPSKTMLCILVGCGFSGVNITFWSSLFASCIGHTLAFGPSAKSYMGLVVVFVGVGEITGSGLMNLRRFLSPTGLVSIFGYTSALFGAFICYIMLPADSPMGETIGPTYVQPIPAVCMFVAFLFGLVDAVWNTQISVLIGNSYRSKPDDVPVAFSLYRCIQSIMAAVTFAYCRQLLLHWQVLIYVLWATAATVGYFCAHYDYVGRVYNRQL